MDVCSGEPPRLDTVSDGAIVLDMLSHLAAASILTTVAGQPFCTSHDELQDYAQALLTGGRSALERFKTCQPLPAGLSARIVADVTDEPADGPVRTLWIRIIGTDRKPVLGYTFSPADP